MKALIDYMMQNEKHNEEQDNRISELEQIMIASQVTSEYIACLAEINQMGE